MRLALRRLWHSASDDAEDRLERGDAGEAGGIHCGAHGGLVVGGPFCAIAVRHLSLDHAGSQPPLALVVRGLDLAGKIAERQELIASAGDLGQTIAGESASSYGAENDVEIALQRAALGFERRGGEGRDVSGQSEGASQPELQPEGDIVARLFFDEAGLAVEMSQTGLLPFGMTLLSGVAVRDPHVGTMVGHGLAHDRRAARKFGAMHNRVLSMARQSG